jgi:hypothetical protein
MTDLARAPARDNPARAHDERRPCLRLLADVLSRAASEAPNRLSAVNLNIAVGAIFDAVAAEDKGALN